MIGHGRFRPVKGLLPKWKFKYDRKTDTYRCPNGETLSYSTTDREGYRQYKSDPIHCIQRPLLVQCTRSKNHQKVITRHVWEEG